MNVHPKEDLYCLLEARTGGACLLREMPTGGFQTVRRLVARVRSSSGLKSALRYPFSELSTVTRAARRRQSWLFDQLTVRKLANLALNGSAYLARSSSIPSVPSVVKIDISPLCSLQCPVCVHAAPEGREKPILSVQSFRKTDVMSVSDFKSIIDKLEGKALAVSFISAIPSCIRT